MAETTRGFNADQRAEKREAGPVRIGGVTYHPRRLTNKRLREVRRMSRRASEEARRAGRDSEDYKRALADAREAGLEEAEAKRRAEEAGTASDEVDEINTRSLAEQLPQLLVDDDLQPMSTEAVERHLEEDLDARDVGDLMDYLIGGAPEAENPTGETEA